MIVWATVLATFFLKIILKAKILFLRWYTSIVMWCTNMAATLENASTMHGRCMDDTMLRSFLY